MKDLLLVTARGGSKGIPGKNIKLLRGRPLICYTLDAARSVAADEHICVSTDSEEILRVVRDYGLDVPFKRPASLATDTAGSYEVILHALDFYEQRGVAYDRVVLLQPTSPFRTGAHVRGAVALYRPGLDMVVSVKRSRANPYFNLFEESGDGFLTRSKPEWRARRQDCPEVYEINGAIYVMSVQSLKQGPHTAFSKIVKYVMSEEDSLDIDTPVDWVIAEALLGSKSTEGESR